MSDQATNIIPFPQRYRGDPDPRRQALAQIGFRWTGVAWRRGRVWRSSDRSGRFLAVL